MPALRLVVAFLVPLFLAPLAASAQRAARLEKATSRLAKTRMAGTPVTVIKNKKVSVWLRPETRTIAVTKTGLLTFSERGYTLGADGRLSLSDRAALEADLAARAPDATPRSIRAGVRAGIARFRDRELVLRGQETLIKDLLGRAGATRGSGDVDIWQRGGAYLTYRPSAGVLVGGRGLSQEGFSLTRTADGDLALEPSSLDRLREFLADDR